MNDVIVDFQYWGIFLFHCCRYMVKPSVRGSNIMPQPQQTQLMQVSRNAVGYFSIRSNPFHFFVVGVAFFSSILPKMYRWCRNRNSYRYHRPLKRSVGALRRLTSYRRTQPTAIPPSELCSVYYSNTIIQLWCSFTCPSSRFEIL